MEALFRNLFLSHRSSLRALFLRSPSSAREAMKIPFRGNPRQTITSHGSTCSRYTIGVTLEQKKTASQGSGFSDVSASFISERSMLCCSFLFRWSKQFDTNLQQDQGRASCGCSKCHQVAHPFCRPPYPMPR